MQFIVLLNVAYKRERRIVVICVIYVVHCPLSKMPLIHAAFHQSFKLQVSVGIEYHEYM
jgi:hypothetical protein